MERFHTTAILLFVHYELYPNRNSWKKKMNNRRNVSDPPCFQELWESITEKPLATANTLLGIYWDI